MTSEYERKRLERIERNEEFLAALEVEKEKDTLTAPKRAEKKRKAEEAKKRAQARKKRREEAQNTPRRSSGRLKGEKAEDFYIEGIRNGKIRVGALPGSMTRDPSRVQSRTTEFDSTKAVRKSRYDEEELLDLETVGENGVKTGTGFFTALKESKEVREFASTELDYAADLSKLECRNAVKIIPNRGYSVKFHPDLPLCVAGDRDGHIGMLRIPENSEDEYSDNALLEYRPHASTVNNLDFVDTKLFSFSYDGSVRKMDLNHPGKFELIYGSKMEANVWSQYGILSPDRKQTIVTFSDGSVVCTDLEAKKAAWNFRPHEKKVQTVSMDRNSRFICTASLDRTICLWDVRKLGSNVKKPSPICTFNDDYSVNACFFDGTGTKLVSCGQSDRIFLFENAHKSGETLEPTHSIKHNNKTGRYLSVFHPSWDMKNTGCFLMGSLATPRRVEVFSTEKGKIKLLMNLQGSAIGSVHSRNSFHPSANLIACLNSSGKLTIFR